MGEEAVDGTAAKMGRRSYGRHVAAGDATVSLSSAFTPVLTKPDNQQPL